MLDVARVCYNWFNEVECSTLPCTRFSITTLLACRDCMPQSGLTLEKAQEDYEKGLKIEQDFAEYFTGTVKVDVLVYVVCVLCH